MHVEILVEDRSTAAGGVILGRLLPDSPDFTWRTTPFHGKQRMLKHLPGTLYSLAQARYADRVIVVIDQDRDDCVTLKQDIVEIAIEQGLVPREHLTIDTLLRVRIAMHELETWFLGDPDAVRAAYPGARLRYRATIRRTSICSRTPGSAWSVCCNDAATIVSRNAQSRGRRGNRPTPQPRPQPQHLAELPAVPPNAPRGLWPPYR